MAGLTIDNPVKLATALASGNVIPGDTINLRAGTYTGPFTVGVAGTADVPIIIKSYNGERAIIDGHFVCNANCIFIGIEFCYSGWANRAASVSRFVDVPATAHRIEFYNCVFRDIDTGAIANILAQATVFNGCLFFFNGWDSDQGHGLYLGNSALMKLVKDCILHSNYGYNLHAFADGPTEPPAVERISNITIDGNISFYSGSPRNVRQANILLGGSGYTRPTNCIVKNNITYFRTVNANGGYGLRLGSGAYGSDGCQMLDNHCVGGQYSAGMTNPSNATVTGNTFIGDVDFDPKTYPDNTYLSDYPANGLDVFVRPNDTINTRANVAVFNWALADAVTVDLSTVAGLQAGDVVSVNNVQDIYVDIQTLILDANKRITVDMQSANHSIATPVQGTASPTTFPRFGAFVVIKN